MKYLFHIVHTNYMNTCIRMYAVMCKSYYMTIIDRCSHTAEPVPVWRRYVHVAISIVSELAAIVGMRHGEMAVTGTGKVCSTAIHV